MNNFKIFQRSLCQWNGHKIFDQEYSELLLQITELLQINGGLARGNRCETEAGYKAQMEMVNYQTERAKILGESIKTALGIK